MNDYRIMAINQLRENVCGVTMLVVGARGGKSALAAELAFRMARINPNTKMFTAGRDGVNPIVAVTSPVTGETIELRAKSLENTKGESSC